MKKRSALYALPWGDESLMLIYVDEANYPKLKMGDESALVTAWILDSSLIIEFENGKPVFDGIAP